MTPVQANKWMEENKVQPYLFGRLDPRGIMLGIMKCLKEIHARAPKTVWQYFDGIKVRQISPETGIEICQEWQWK